MSKSATRQRTVWDMSRTGFGNPDVVTAFAGDLRTALSTETLSLEPGAMQAGRNLACIHHPEWSDTLAQRAARPVAKDPEP